MKFRHPLMHNNITKDDINHVISFLKTNPILTQSKKVYEFEKMWSKWLGVKYSVFVNSGSSANFITIAALKEKLNKGRNEIIIPPLTWPSDVMAVINNGFKPKFVDINIENLCMNSDKIINSCNKKTAAVFITHAQGFNGLNNKLVKFLKRKKIYLIEDVCESHGAIFNKKKLGTFGFASNFSFYYAHHLSTIEGGMVCTNDKSFYDFCIRFRAHGMLRESKFNTSKIKKKYKDLNDKFIFLNPGFNFRNNEIGAVIGINQIKRLDKEIKKRNDNFKYFLKKLNKDKFFTNFDLKGISNYAFPIILKTKSITIRNKFEKYLDKNGIEFRRGNAGGGNQLRQPYLKNIKKTFKINKFINTDRVHFYGYYIGNFPSLSKSKINKIIRILNYF